MIRFVTLNSEWPMKHNEDLRTQAARSLAPKARVT